METDPRIRSTIPLTPLMERVLNLHSEAARAIDDGDTERLAAARTELDRIRARRRDERCSN